MGIVSANLVAPYLDSGKLTAIGVTSSKRYNALPNVPTLEEQGVKPFDYYGWYGLMGPAGLSPDVVSKITAGANQVLDDPAIQKALYTAGIEVKKGSAEELSRTIEEDSDRYFKMARELNINAE